MATLLAAFLPTAFSPSVYGVAFTPKYALLMLAGAIGAVPLLRLARGSTVKTGARFAVGFLLAALLAALLSNARNIGVFGLDGSGTGWLFWFGCAGAFAIGASLRTTDRPWVMGGLLFGGAVNAAVGIYQAIGLPASGALYPYHGTQADGLLGNPIHLEALLLGCLALIAKPAVQSPRRWWPMVLLLGVGLELTLQRLAIVILVIVLLVTVATLRMRRTLPFAGLALGGYLIGYLGAGSGLAARVTNSTSESTWGLRFHVWESAGKALVQHPLLGVGPGQTIVATAPRMTEALARAVGPGALPFDAHDFLVEVLVTTGLVGFVLFGGWLFCSGLRAAGSFLGFAAAILAVELVEPLNVGVTPVAFLAIGVATVGFSSRPRRWRRRLSRSAGPQEEAAPSSGPLHRGQADRPQSRAGILVTTVLVVAALFVGVTMVWADALVSKGHNDAAPAGKIADFIDASRLAPYWPDIYQGVAGAYAYEAVVLHQPGLIRQARPWTTRAVMADPADPVARADVGNLDLTLGLNSLAAAEYRHALRLDPWTASAFAGLAHIAAADRQWGQALHYLELESAVSPISSSLQLAIVRAERKLHR